MDLLSSPYMLMVSQIARKYSIGRMSIKFLRFKFGNGNIIHDVSFVVLERGFMLIILML